MINAGYTDMSGFFCEIVCLILYIKLFIDQVYSLQSSLYSVMILIN